MPSPIPSPTEDDVDDVRWALSTAAALWESGEREKALSYVRRAAEAAGDSGEDRRALELAKAAVDIVAMVPAAEPPDKPSPPGERADDAEKDVETEQKDAAEVDQAAAPVDKVPDDVEGADAPGRLRSKPPPPPRRGPPTPPPGDSKPARDSKPAVERESAPGKRDLSPGREQPAQPDDDTKAKLAALQPSVFGEAPEPSAGAEPAAAPARASQPGQVERPRATPSAPGLPPARTKPDAPEGLTVLNGIPVAVMRMTTGGQARIIAVGPDGRRPVGAASAILLPISTVDAEAIAKLLAYKRS